MSHRCGTGRRRRQSPSRRSGCPSGGSRRRLDAGGRIRTVSQHMIDYPHPGITRRMTAHVLDHWVVRGIRTDNEGRQSWNYYAIVPESGTMLRVAVSLDDMTIISSFKDESATRAWNRGELTYFNRVLSEVEVRSESESSL